MSQTTQHTPFTPGPWTTNAEEKGVFGPYKGKFTQSAIIANCNSVSRAETENRANARLIANAPEMYALLEELLSDYEQDWAGEEPRPLSDFELRLQRVITDVNPTRNAPMWESQPDYDAQP